MEYKEASAASAVRNRLEMDGIKTEQNAALLKVFQECRFFVYGILY